jgi:hypothetical protein
MKKRIHIGKIYRSTSGRRFKVTSVDNSQVYLQEEDGFKCSINICNFKFLLKESHDIRNTILKLCLQSSPYIIARILVVIISHKYLWWYPIVDFVVLFCLIGIPTILYLHKDKKKELSWGKQ